MADNFAQQFIDALHRLEAERDVDTIVNLFSDDCEIGNVVTEDKNISPKDFWQSYRENFGEVNSEFRNQIVAGDTIALEWTTTGTSGAGNEVKYDGVSIIETSGDRITRFHAYFDPNKLGKQMEAAANS